MSASNIQDKPALDEPVAKRPKKVAKPDDKLLAAKVKQFVADLNAIIDPQKILSAGRIYVGNAPRPFTVETKPFAYKIGVSTDLDIDIAEPHDFFVMRESKFGLEPGTVAVIKNPTGKTAQIATSLGQPLTWASLEDFNIAPVCQALLDFFSAYVERCTKRKLKFDEKLADMKRVEDMFYVRREAHDAKKQAFLAQTVPCVFCDMPLKLTEVTQHFFGNGLGHGSRFEDLCGDWSPADIECYRKTRHIHSSDTGWLKDPKPKPSASAIRQ